MSKHSDVLSPLFLGEREMGGVSNSSAPMRKRMKGNSIDSLQLGLFDTAMTWDPLPAETPPQKSRTPRRQIKNERPAHKAQPDTARLVTLEDMPTYPADVMEMVDNSIASLPGEAVWLTYRDVGKHFGISRATMQGVSATAWCPACASNTSGCLTTAQ